MSSSMLSVAVESAAMGVWPVVVFLGVVVVVTVIALVRANRDDVPRVFAAFASAFGFRVVRVDDDTAPEPAADAGDAAAGDAATEVGE